MKTLNLKNFLPVAVVALAVSGAFITTSMQSAPKKSAVTFQWGNLANPDGSCQDIQTPCSDNIKPQLCRLNDLSGPVAYQKDDNNRCVQPYYRLVNGE